MNDSVPISLGGALEGNAAAAPQKPAVICSTGSYNYAELNAETNALSNGWLNSGARPGQIVCSFLPKGFAFAVCFLATQKLGLVFASINAATQPQILTGQLRMLSAAYYVLPKDLKDSNLARTIKAVDPDALILTVERHTSSSRILKWTRLSAVGSESNPVLSIDVDRVCYLNFTSGTTGLPKAALGTAANIFWNATAAISALDLRQDDIHLCTFPSFLHPHELIARAMYLAGTCSLVESEVKQIWNMLLEGRVSCIASIPTILELLVEYSGIV